MAKVGAGERIYDLRRQIQGIRAELEGLGGPPAEIRELVDSANLIRTNEYLSLAGEKRARLISAYEQYSEALEGMLGAVFEIQSDLGEILRQQSSMISAPHKKAGKKKPAAKPAKKKPKKTPAKKGPARPK